MRKKINYLLISMLFICLMSGFAWSEEQSQPAMAFSFKFWDSYVQFDPITVTEEELEGKFYYHSLESEEEKLIYKELLQGIRSFKPEILVHGEDAYRAFDIVSMVCMDHSELFWCSGGGQYIKYEKSWINPAYIKMYLYYDYTQAEAESMMREVEEDTAEIIEKLKQEKTDYKKVRRAFRWIINRAAYRENSEHNQNFYSAIVKKKTVCAGYARSMQYLLEKAGVECIYAVGVSGNTGQSKESHAWNIVNCNGKYYHVDATWGEPFNEYEEKNHKGHKNRPINYSYLCVNDKQILDTHMLSLRYSYPKCQSNDLNYYKLNGSYYTSFSKKETLNAMKKSIRNGDKYEVFQYSTKKSYKKSLKAIKTDLLNKANQYRLSYYNYRRVVSYYEYYPDDNRIIVYWGNK